MGVFEQFPYTNFHDLNLDWILKKMKDLDKEVTEYIKNNKIQSADPFNWNIQSQYPANTLVADPENNTVYLSVQAVPAGVALSNKEYWQPVFTLQALWDALDDVMESVAPINQGADTQAQQQMEVNELFWLNHNLYIVTSQILRGQEITSANSRHVTIEEMLLQAQSYLMQKINKNTDDIEDLQAYDKTQDTRISNIVSQAGSDNTEIVDGRLPSAKFNHDAFTTIGDALRWATAISVNSYPRVITGTPKEPFNDFNTFPTNQIVAYQQLSTPINNAPDNMPNGLCVTIGYMSTESSSLVRYQVVMDANNEYAYRYCTGKTWTTWIRGNVTELITARTPSAKFNNDAFTTVGDALRWATAISVNSYPHVITGTPKEPFNDFNTFPTNQIVAYQQLSTPIDNAPDNMPKGLCVTIGYMSAESSSAERYQVVLDANNEYAYRYCTSKTWTTWVRGNVTESAIKIYNSSNYSSLYECFKAVSANPSQEKILNIEAGTYDLYNEMGGDSYFNGIDVNNLPDWRTVNPLMTNVKIYGQGDVIINFNMNPDTPKEVRKLFSPINVVGTSTIKNITINCSYCRYAIHDERINPNINETDKHRIFENLKLTKTNGATRQVIGTGWGTGNTLHMNNCILTSDDEEVWTVHTGGKCYATFSNCQFITTKPNADNILRFSGAGQMNIDNCYASRGSVLLRAENFTTEGKNPTQVLITNSNINTITNNYQGGNTYSSYKVNTIEGTREELIHES